MPATEDRQVQQRLARNAAARAKWAERTSEQRKSRNLYQRFLRRRYIIDGLCHQCGKPRETNRLRCDRCRTSCNDSKRRAYILKKQLAAQIWGPY